MHDADDGVGGAGSDRVNSESGLMLSDWQTSPRRRQKRPSIRGSARELIDLTSFGALTGWLCGNHTGLLSPAAGVTGSVLSTPGLPRAAKVAVDAEFAGTGTPTSSGCAAGAAIVHSGLWSALFSGRVDARQEEQETSRSVNSSVKKAGPLKVGRRQGLELDATLCNAKDAPILTWFH